MRCALVRVVRRDDRQNWGASGSTTRVSTPSVSSYRSPTSGRVFGATRFDTHSEQFAPPDLTELARVISRLRERGGLPVRTIGFWGRRDEECEQGCSIVGLTSDLSFSPCLLSRRRTPVQRSVSGETVSTTLSLLREEVRMGLWEPVCDAFAGNDSESKSALPILQK